VGVPYEPGYENEKAFQELRLQQRLVVAGLKTGDVAAEPDREIIALIAYLQRLGADIKAASASSTATTASAAP
jgi:cytochrome c oxidase cbb3-type subunit I/II